MINASQQKEIKDEDLAVSLHIIFLSVRHQEH